MSKNFDEFELLNINAWHKAGYTGQGVKIMELEGANPSNPQFDGMLTNDFKDDLDDDDYDNSHGSHVFDVIHQICPDSKLYVGSVAGRFSNDTITGDVIDKTIPYIEEKGIHLIGASLGGYNVEQFNKELRRLKEKGHVFFTSAGNAGEKGAGEFAQSREWINTGAVHLRNGKPYRPSYSAIDEVLDFTSYSNLYVESDNREGYWFPQQGTSFSNPCLMSMAGLLNCYAIKHIDRTLTQDEIYAIFLDNVVDLGQTGKDEFYGHGLVVLPDPATFDLNKYIGGDNNMENISTIKLYPQWSQSQGEIYYVKNGERVYMDIKPEINNGRTMIPLRFMAEAMGARVGWDEKTGEVTIEFVENSIE